MAAVSPAPGTPQPGRDAPLARGKEDGCSWSLDNSWASVTRPAQAVRPFSPGGRFGNSPPFQGWDSPKWASSPEGTAELLPRKLEYRRTIDIRWIQPSLRDLWGIESEPGSELPGYSQISLRENGNASPRDPNTSGRRDA